MPTDHQDDPTVDDSPKDVLVLRRRRVVVATAGVALASLLLGLVAARQITSPKEIAARTRAPEAENIIERVELREIHSNVITRGDVVYDGAAGVLIETSGLNAPALVTGRVPKVGDNVTPGAVLLELAGRPVLVLGGDVPVYRSLAPGMSGSDVVQLETALRALGLDVGDPAEGTYDARTAAAVAALYERVGYTAPEPDEEAASKLESADETLQSAEDAFDEAQAALTEATLPPPEAEVAQANAAVTAAEQALARAKTGGDPGEIEAAQSELTAAKGERDVLLAGKGSTVEAAAVARAKSRLGTAQNELAAAKLAAATPLPAAEVVYLPNLPRRIDVVNVVRGQELQGEAAVQVSGADLVVVASLTEADAPLVKEGMTAQLEAAGQRELTGKIRAVRATGATVTAETTTTTAAAPGAGGKEAVIVLSGLTADEIAAVRGTNVQVTIPVAATRGKVLAVPLAAVSMGPAGESRVEVVREGGETELVEVEVGLVADGRAEVTPADGALVEDDQVVVGR